MKLMQLLETKSAYQNDEKADKLPIEILSQYLNCVEEARAIRFFILSTITEVQLGYERQVLRLICSKHFRANSEVKKFDGMCRLYTKIVYSPLKHSNKDAENNRCNLD